MGRLVLIVLTSMALTSVAGAQSVSIGAYEELARQMDARDWQGALSAARRVLEVRGSPTPLRDSVECMVAELTELRLRDHLDDASGELDDLSRGVSGVASTIRDLVAAYPRCNDNAPTSVDVNRNEARRTQLSYIEPRATRAATLITSARESGSVSAELEQVFSREHAELVEQIPAAPDGAWERAERLWREQRTPASQPREWPARGEGPIIGTGVLFLGFGLVSFFSSLTALSGRGLPSLSAGGWGITFSLLPALMAAWTWERAERGILVASLVLTGVAAGGGAIAIARLGRDGRYFGRGLLIGSALSAVWQVGGWVHHHYPDRSRREWQERVRISPTGGPGFGGLSAEGRF